MDIATARKVVTDWVVAQRSDWQGLRAAHLVGSVSGMNADELLPAHKDIDLHAVFDTNSPLLLTEGPFPNLIETEYAGLLIEAGIKSVDAYSTPEAVLANPEVAHHLTLDSVLYDPDGLLAELQPRVREEYAKRKWVQARLAAERNSLAGAMSLLPMATAMLGASGQINLLGYSFTFVAAALQLVKLEAPSTGSHALPRLHGDLTEFGRPDLYDTVLELLGVGAFSASRVETLLAEAAESFDLAVEVRRSPHPFQHKLHAHLRPYFVQSCQELLNEGLHRESLAWLLPFFLSACDVILADGREAEKPRFAALQEGFIAELGLADAADRESTFRRLAEVQAECFALATRILETNPSIHD